MNTLKDKKDIKVATVAYYFHPQNNAESLVATRLLNTESDIRYNVYTHESEEINELSLVKNLKIIQIRNSISSSFLNWRILNNKYIWAIRVFNKIKNSNFDIIYTRSTPIIDHFVGLFLKIKTGKPWVIHFSDPWLDSPYRTKKPILDYFLKYLEDILFKKSNFIIVTNENFASFLKKKDSKLAHKIIVLYHPVNNLQLSNPSIKSKSDKIILSHIGCFYGKRSPNELLGLLNEIDRKDFELNFVGNNRADEIFNAVRDSIVFEKIMFLGKVDYNESLRLGLGSDYLLLVDANLPKESLFLPSKLMDYFVIKKPIIAITNKESPVHKILKEQEQFLLFYEDSKEINIDKLENIIKKRLTWENNYSERMLLLFDSKSLNIKLNNLFMSNIS
ncbi:MAG: hypothetical protein K9M36_00530 [Candidatus Pacebacteria bacterium]|nr:hypothetical protein [Candidatus Paceibacterota bacterium]